MANEHSFPLLRLPCLARGHVIMVMNVREQYLFSTLSKKSKRIAKNGVRPLRYLFHLELLSSALNFNIRKDCFSRWLSINILSMEAEEDKDTNPVNDLTLRMEDYQEESIKTLSFLKDLFKISSFVIDCKKTPNEFAKRFLTCVQNLKIGITELEVGPEDGENQNELYSWIMENCRDVKTLKNFCQTSPDFEFDSQKSFNFDYCHLSYAYWLTLDHITRLFWDCKLFKITNYDYKLTDRDFNKITKMWMKGDSKLEYLEMPVNESYKFQKVMKDIEKVQVKKAYLQNILFYFSPGTAFKIQRNDGQEAVVCLTPGEEFIITTHFDEKDCDLWSEHGESDVEGWWGDDDDKDEEVDFNLDDFIFGVYGPINAV